MSMNNTLPAMFLALAFMGLTVVLGLSGIAIAATDLCTDAVEAACDGLSNSTERIGEGIFLLAQQDKRFKCLENCNQPRYACEKNAKNKDKPGTKKNWEASTKCQIQYDDCLNKCGE